MKVKNLTSEQWKLNHDPEGIVIDPNDRTYRTSNLNPVFRLINSFTGGKNDSNKKRTSKNTSPSYVVAPIDLFSKQNLCFLNKILESF